MAPPARVPLVLALLALAVVAGLYLWGRRPAAPPAPPAALPGGAIDTTQPGSPLEPLGEVRGGLARFTWRADPAADLYRLEIYDEAGELAGVSVQRDTTITAEALRLDTLRAGRWRVVPVGAGGSERPDRGTATFRVVRP